MYDDLYSCIELSSSQLFAVGGYECLFYGDNSMTGNFMKWILWKRDANTRYNLVFYKEANFDTSKTYQITMALPII